MTYQLCLIHQIDPRGSKVGGIELTYVFCFNAIRMTFPCYLWVWTNAAIWSWGN